MSALTLALVLLDAAQVDPSPAWEIAKGVMLTLSTLGIGWLCRTVMQVRDGQRDLKHTVVGVDGSNGLQSKVGTLIVRVDSIEERNARIDAVTEYEKQHYQGEERRMGSRRVRDVVRDVEEGKGQ